MRSSSSSSSGNHKVMTPNRRSESFPRSSEQAASAATSSSAPMSVPSTVDDAKMTALLNSIASKQASCLMQQPSPVLTMTLYISTASVGAVIGRKGQAISQLQQLASRQATTQQPVRISVMGAMATEQQQQQQQQHGGYANHTTDNSNVSLPPQQSLSSTTSVPPTYTPLDLTNTRDWTPVVIRADPKACLVAALHIYHQLLPVGGCDDVVLDVPVSRAKHGSLLRGMLLATASADFNTRIMVPARQYHSAVSQHNNNHNIIQLEGDLLNVIQCLDRIFSILQTAGKPNTVKQDVTMTTAESPAAAATATMPAFSPASQTILVHQLPAQTKIRTITRKTDTVIRTRKQKNKGGAAESSTTTAATTTTSDDVMVADDVNNQNTSSSAVTWELTVTGPTFEAVQAAVDLLQATAAGPTRPRQRRHRAKNKAAGGGGVGGVGGGGEK